MQLICTLFGSELATEITRPSWIKATFFLQCSLILWVIFPHRTDDLNACLIMCKTIFFPGNATASEMVALSKNGSVFLSCGAEDYLPSAPQSWKKDGVEVVEKSVST